MLFRSKVSPRRDDAEFFAAVARAHVFFAEGFGDFVGDCFEHGVARRMPVRVVDRLQVVDVDEQDADVGVRAHGLELQRQVGHELAAVRHAREGVAAGAELEVGAQAARLGLVDELVHEEQRRAALVAQDADGVHDPDLAVRREQVVTEGASALSDGTAVKIVPGVAGLGVAIPALFGYNWLASRIKNISADMQIFVDEFVTRVAETHGAR